MHPTGLQEHLRCFVGFDPRALPWRQLRTTLVPAAPYPSPLCTRYVSPEVIDNRDAEPSADMWALGCIVFQMLSGSPPFAADSEYLIFKRIEKCEYEFPEHFHHHARGLVGASVETARFAVA